MLSNLPTLPISAPPPPPLPPPHPSPDYKLINFPVEAVPRLATTQLLYRFVSVIFDFLL